MKNYNKFKIFMIFTVILSALLSLLSPLLINYWTKFNLEITNVRIMILVAVMLSIIFIQILIAYVRENFAKKFNKFNFYTYLDSFFKLKYDYINKQGPMTLLERMIIGVNSIYQYLTNDIIQIYSKTLIIIGILCIVFFQSKSIFIILLAIAPIYYGGYKMLNKELAFRSKQLQVISSTGWSAILSIIEQTDFIKQAGNYENIKKLIDSPLDNIYKAQSSVNIFAKTSSVLLSGITTLSQTLIMVISVVNGLKNHDYMSILLISVLVPLYFQNLESITNANLSKRDFDISNNFFKTWEAEYEHCGQKTLQQIDSIELNLNSIHIGENTIPMNIKETFNKGDRVWIKGNSGSGKSTLVKLLIRFRDENGVLINGIDIREYDLLNIRQSIDYISQNIPIIKGSLRDNLFLDIPYSKEIEQSMIEDKLLSSILQNKNMDSPITEGAGNLSGGEKQKIVVMRALYKNPQVLILDEITSGLDENIANEIYDRIFEKMKNGIVFVISHNNIHEKYINRIVEL